MSSFVDVKSLTSNADNVPQKYETLYNKIMNKKFVKKK